MKIQTFSIALIAACLSLPAIGNEDPWQLSHKLEAQTDYAGAAQAIQSVIRSDAKHEYALTRNGWLSYLQKDYNTSVAHYKSAIEVNPNSLDAQLGITLPLMAQGRWQEAANHAKQVLKVAPHQYYADIRLMACEEALMQWNALLEHAQKASRIYPTDATILIYLARAASVTGKNKLAIDAYKSVLERTPGNFEAIRFLASNNMR